MKKKVTLTLLIALFITSCLSSPGWSAYKQAKDAQKRGDYASALFYASQSLVNDIEMPFILKMVNQDFDFMLKMVEAENQRFATPKTSAEAEKLAHNYKMLVGFYNNLKKLQLPIVDPKGKWSWETTIKDYSNEAEKYRNLAYDMLFNDGEALVRQGEIKSAEQKFKYAYNKYLLESEKSTEQKRIADSFCNWAKTLQQVSDINLLLKGIEAYNTALNFFPNYEKAIVGKSDLSRHISDIYVALGLEEENKGTIQGYEAALKNYETALKWNSNNSQAIAGKNAIPPKIAELYYQIGVANEAKGDDKSVGVAIDAFKNALKWIPNYKDSNFRLNRIFLNKEIIAFKRNLSEAQAEMSKAYTSLKSIEKSVGSAKRTADNLFFLTDTAIKLNSDMKSTATTLNVFRPIPKVGQITHVMANQIENVQKPLGVCVTKIQKVQKPYIDPVRNQINNINNGVKSAATSVDQANTNLSKMIEFTALIEVFMSKNPEAGAVKAVEENLKFINSNFSSIISSMKKGNSAFSSADQQLKFLNNSAGSINSFKKGIDNLYPVIKDVSKIAREVESVLNKQIGFGGYTVSAREILNGINNLLSPIVKGLEKALSVVLNPVLDKLNLKIPSIPAIPEVNNLLDGMENCYKSVTNCATFLTNDMPKIPGLVNQINMKMAETVGILKNYN
ncbi:MAG: hypothetical protein JXR63_02030 [Spirochaetales bacterium]|nr:hypothetical protein [Spirochaetales bacterium]